MKIVKKLAPSNDRLLLPTSRPRLRSDYLPWGLFGDGFVSRIVCGVQQNILIPRRQRNVLFTQLRVGFIYRICRRQDLLRLQDLEITPFKQLVSRFSIDLQSSF